MFFSAFARFGHLRFSSQPPLAQTIYENMVEAMGGEELIGDDFDSTLHAELYADAMALATAKRNFDRVFGNDEPTTAVELLPYHEEVFGDVPQRGESEDDRRTSLGISQQAIYGSRGDNLEDALTALLGDLFIAVRTINSAEYSVSPSNWSTPATRPGTWKPPQYPSKWRITTSQVTSAGVAGVSSDALGNEDLLFEANDVVVIEPGILGRQEAVTLTSVDLAGGFVATFTRSHPVGSVVTTEPWPTASSTSRHILIVVDTTVAESTAWRKKITKVLRKLLRVVDTFDIVEESSLNRLGPFTVGEGKIGITPLGDAAMELPIVNATAAGSSTCVGEAFYTT